MEKPSVLLRFGPLLFYPLEFLLWAITSLGILAGVDIRKFLGVLGVVAWPIFGLFILGSVVAHIVFLVKHHYQFLLPLFLANFFGIIGYVIFVFIVLSYACYGGGSCF